jgi:hypothetical protein
MDASCARVTHMGGAALQEDALRGKVVLVSRGGCHFVTMVRRLQVM